MDPQKIVSDLAAATAAHQEELARIALRGRASLAAKWRRGLRAEARLCLSQIETYGLDVARQAAIKRAAARRAVLEAVLAQSEAVAS